MSDLLLDLSRNSFARGLVKRVGLPLPMPQSLARAEGPAVERFAEGRRVLVEGDGILIEQVAPVLARGGATPLVRSEPLAKRFQGASEAWARPVELLAREPAGDGPPLDAFVVDATAFGDVRDLEQLHGLFHPWLPRLARCGRVVLLGRPVEEAGSASEAAARAALDGFNRSLAKELGGRGATSNLLVVEAGAETRIAAPLRFLLSGASAFVTAQPLRISGRASWDEADPWVRPLDGRVALVTGAARGIGAATAAVLAAEGARVVCLDRPAEDASLARTARKVGGSPLLVDVTDAQAPARIASELAERHGGVDVIVHNAGVTRDKTLARMSADRWQQVLDINLAAALRVTHALLEGPLHDRGRIVCLASVAGIAGNVGQTNYAASKAGLIGFARHLGRELAPRGVTVNAVAPGFIETQMTAAMPFVVRQAGRRLAALGQGGQPEDVARAIAFLAAPGAAGLTGQVLRVCGGALLGA